MDRSDIMRRVKSKSTSPEMVIRCILHSHGYRYRLNLKSIPGSPDIAFIGRKKAIFVNGCFWHGHSCRKGLNQPKTNVDYWSAKIQRNIQRDVAVIQSLKEIGWETIVIWECELSELNSVQNRLLSFLGPANFRLSLGISR